MREGKCTFCETDGTLFHIRGRETCLKCQLEFLWDFVEGTRRITEQGEVIWGPSQPSSREQDIEMTDAEYDALPKIIRDQLKKVM